MCGELIIRRIRADEHESAAHVWKTSWESAGISHPNDLPYSALLQRFNRELERNWDLYVADLNDQIVGLLALKVSQNQLDQLFVAPGSQRQGVGKKLLHFSKTILPDKIWLRTAEKNERAIAFYKSKGFAVDRIEPRPEWDRNDVILVWRGS